MLAFSFARHLFPPSLRYLDPVDITHLTPRREHCDSSEGLILQLPLALSFAGVLCVLALALPLVVFNGSPLCIPFLSHFLPPAILGYAESPPFLSSFLYRSCVLHLRHPLSSAFSTQILVPQAPPFFFFLQIFFCQRFILLQLFLSRFTSSSFFHLVLVFRKLFLLFYIFALSIRQTPQFYFLHIRVVPFPPTSPPCPLRFNTPSSHLLPSSFQ